MQSSPITAVPAESGGAERPGAEPDDAILTVVARLSRPHRGGGHVIERAAILAEGPSSAAVLRWIAAHAGEPEAQAAAPAGRGLHGDRATAGGRPPLRYVLPPGALARPA